MPEAEGKEPEGKANQSEGDGPEADAMPRPKCRRAGGARGVILAHCAETSC
jgi:hypothetical protein